MGDTRRGESRGDGTEKLTLKRCKDLFVRHLHFVGPGLVSSVAYIDPGNWATDLQAGAEFGYKLLFVVLVAGLAAVVLQTLSVRLGAITSTSLPVQTRLLFIRLQARYPKYRIPLKIALYSLYALAEIAIIGTDLAELIGSAIALNLLFPRLPLFAGVLITAVDVLIVLLFFRSSSGRQGMLLFEIVIVSLVLAVFVSFMILLKLTSPVWKDVFLGLIPSKTLVKPGALYVGVGIIGATVMPHALFLGSHLASVDRLNMLPISPSPIKPPRSVSMPSLNPFRRSNKARRPTSPAPSTQSDAERADTLVMHDLAMPSSDVASRPTQMLETESQIKDLPVGMTDNLGKEERAFVMAQKEYEAEIRAFDRIAWVDVHLLHSTIDTILSLLGFALTINASILTLAGAAFYYGTSGATVDDADLFGAHALIKSYIGNAAALIFALALLCAGQSASITATLAGQVVSEGFINWKTSPFVRRLITRLIGVVPAAVIAAAVGAQGLNTMLVASQVLLSIVLPTVIFPLVYLCSQEGLMTVQGPEVDLTVVHRVASRSVSGTSMRGDNGDENDNDNDNGIRGRHASPQTTPDSAAPAISAHPTLPAPSPSASPSLSSPPPRRTKSYASPKWITVLGYFLFAVVVVANMYVIVELGLGNS